MVFAFREFKIGTKISPFPIRYVRWIGFTTLIGCPWIIKPAIETNTKVNATKFTGIKSRNLSGGLNQVVAVVAIVFWLWHKATNLSDGWLVTGYALRLKRISRLPYVYHIDRIGRVNEMRCQWNALKRYTLNSWAKVAIGIKGDKLRIMIGTWESIIPGMPQDWIRADWGPRNTERMWPLFSIGFWSRYLCLDNVWLGSGVAHPFHQSLGWTT